MMNNQEAIEHLKNIMIFSYQDGYTAEAREALDMAIKALEAQEWIPVKERLPEEGQSILVTADGWRMVAIIRTFFKVMHKDIIAWMPLPEPYRAERRTDGRDWS